MNGIYLDHAATTPLDREVLQKMLPYFTERYGNADSPHGAGREAMRAVDEARDSLAELLGVKPSELYFTSGGTEADNWAIRGGAYAMRERGRTQILLSAIEHHAALATAKKLEGEGFEIAYLPVNEGGRVEAKALREAITERTGLVCVMAVNNETGVRQPICELAEIARQNGSLFFSDCVQAAPYEELRPREWGVDMLSFSSHKLYGPKGCGALYIKSGTPVKGLIVGGEQERGLRGGTTNVPAVVGFAAAYAKNRATMQAANGKLAALRALFLEELRGVDGLSVNGEGSPAILNLRARGVKNIDLVYAMDLQGVCIAAGAACASASVKPSHALLAMGLDEQAAQESVRISFGRENTADEVLVAARKFAETVERLREKIL